MEVVLFRDAVENGVLFSFSMLTFFLAYKSLSFLY